MVQAWYMCDKIEDQRLENKTNPEIPVSLEKLAEIGVVYKKVDVDDLEHDTAFEKLKQEHGYTYMDHITCSPDKLPDYDNKLKMFFEEHLHDDEEIRLCMGGSGYFDVRDKEDKWIRIELVKGDMIILPAGIYHRFTLDTKNYIEAKRFFVGDPVWTPWNRPQEENDVRKKYVQQFGIKA